MIYNIFYILLLKLNNNRKKLIDENIIEFKALNNKKYKVEEI